MLDTSWSKTTVFRNTLFFSLLVFSLGLKAQTNASLAPGTVPATLIREPDSLGVYHHADEMPEATVDVSSYLAAHVRYPQKAKRKNIQGRVVIRFVIDKDGSLRDLFAVSSPADILSDEALRVIKAMPKWKPAKLNGEAVPVYFTLPIVFRLAN